MPPRDADFRPAKPSSIWPMVLVVLLLLAGAAGWWYWSNRAPAEPPPVASAPQTPVPDEPPPPPQPTGPQNPVDALAEPDTKLPALNDADARVTGDLNQLLGKKSVASFLQVDGFVRRVVATTDNLTGEQAPSRIWPVQPTAEHFRVQGGAAADSVKTISPDNAARYTPFVQFAESINTARAVALYAKLYPLFQSAYEELGYSGRYFNDRLVAVIDHLMKAPEPAQPPQVKLTDVKGVVTSERPWVRYEFVDPELESLSSGQKIMVRMGPANERRLKAKLAEFRQALATGAVVKK